jgi:hypothetical protein
MRWTASKFPLGCFILQVLEQSGLSHREFFKAIGMANHPSSFDAFDLWLATGEGPGDLVKKIQASSFAIDPERFSKIYDANTEAVRVCRIRNNGTPEEKGRLSFQPYAKAVAELACPTQITMYGLTGGMNSFHIPLPHDMPSRSLADQLAYLKSVIPQSFAFHKGRTHFRGKIVGYQYYRIYDEVPMMLTVTGELNTSNEVPIAVDGQVMLNFRGGKTITTNP